jgi:2-polyprenyl-6-hydroxyphenyl methylase/3-demethylubiquinone-9 3-methyltransferase
VLATSPSSDAGSDVQSGLEIRAAHAAEVTRGERFEFGSNWSRFLRLVDEGRIRQAEASLQRMLRERSLEGRSFLDIGCGSGLFSLAAARLGARVHSFDFDTSSVACTRELHARFAPDAGSWRVEQGSVLDAGYMRSLGTFDVVYSWGVLHHTGRMWDAMAAACGAVAPGGKLYIAIYNDLGTRSTRWRAIKRRYNRLPRVLRPPFTAIVSAPEEGKAVVRALLRGRPADIVRRWRAPRNRGMSHWRDIVDWVGGYPYEYAAPEQIFDFCRDRGFTLISLRCGGVGLGCNEFVFERARA